MEKRAQGQRKKAGRRGRRGGGPAPALLLALAAAAAAALPLLPALARALRACEALGPEAGAPVLGLSGHAGSFLAGAAAFAMVFVSVRFPAKVYVFVHEATHALFALAFGARVSAFRVEEEEGSVDVSRSNAVILLAPYAFPLPAIAALALFGAVSLAVPLVGTAAGAFGAAAAGAAWGFHFCFTVNALLQRQTDLDEYGFFFSVVLLLACNLFFLLAAQVALGPATVGETVRVLRELVAQSYGAAADFFLR
ncbi:MAG: hypothetical protein IJ783_03995 [Kiritimatiellae bacterium]|nr:hypothetical protein [Kiritimatiellia bacterium]